ncbi:MAG: hypothetical protein QM640_06240 [Niabella sp.]
MIFENNVLQHVATEEGRAKMETGAWKFDYFLKDQPKILAYSIFTILSNLGLQHQNANEKTLNLTIKDTVVNFISREKFFPPSIKAP